ncbi:hypothetical protein ACFVYA_44075 [Amycolatopsis sp. NPDC058278]|uniref:hypothetical protein n=1 Tax=Amycolatopsis sp. NPDC058278 TaxID=3346417 RepID=UPI0036D92EE0
MSGNSAARTGPDQGKFGSTAVARITEHDPRRLFGSSFSDVPLSMAYEVARDSVVDGEREAARSLTAFHDTLVEVVRTYRAVDEASAENLRRAGLAP